MKTRQVLKDVLVAGVLCLLSLTAGSAALLLAEFGAPVWVFVVLLAWLLTLGLPTLAGVLLLARFWQGPSFQAYLLSAVLLGFFFQLGAVSGIRRGINRWRRMSAR